MKKGLLILPMVLLLVLSPMVGFAQEIDPGAKAQASCVTLYEHINYGGDSITFCSDDASFVDNGWNDKASSAKVSCSGNGAILYEHINYKGRAWKLESCTNYYDFTQGNNLNDVASSINIL